MAKQPLDELVDKGLLECLNQDAAQPVGNAFDDGDALLASEDGDGDLLVKLQFRQPVKLAALRIEGKGDIDTLPDSVKIFQGKEHMGFGEGDDPATQEEQLNAEALTEKDGQTLLLKFVKFQNVQTLQLLFPSAESGRDRTFIKRIQLFGEPAQKMDMKDFKPIKG